jgi:glutamate synthase (NADPH/NADH) large chain
MEQDNIPKPIPEGWRPKGLPETWLNEHDSCAIVAAVRRTGEATHGNLKRTMDALSKMGHRSGSVNGEGDGVGVLTDIPRRLWSKVLSANGKPAWLAEDQRFFVGHLMIPQELSTRREQVQQEISGLVAQIGASLLVSREGLTRPAVLGRMAFARAPYFWQIAGLVEGCPLEEVEKRLFELALAIERTNNVHAASLSSHVVVYKVRGAIETLYHYYPELSSPDYMTAITLGHARYSTNTTTAFERVQPFSLLGHNGEINTIARLREQAQLLGVQLVEDGSDSQDLDRSLASLIHRYGFSLAEAMELTFPPILSEVANLPLEYQALYRYYRQAFGPFAQGPAALIVRSGDECVFSVDALGLRPLWFGETEKEYFFSSEKGVYPLDNLRGEPIPLAPGEKMRLHLHRNEGVDVQSYPEIQLRVLQQARQRLGSFSAARGLSKNGNPAGAIPQTGTNPTALAGLEFERRLAAFGWSREERECTRILAETGSDPISSLGYDGPLAALSSERQNLADYFKETVAVVTNPSVDREREAEHFSTQTLLGPRAGLLPANEPTPGPLALDCPVLLEGQYGLEAANVGAVALEDVLVTFESEALVKIATVTQPGETISVALGRLADQAVSAVRGGASLILLDDAAAFTNGNGWIDPLLAVAQVDRALQSCFLDSPAGRSVLQKNGFTSLRRQVGLVLRSGAIRNLHDLIISIGLGADAVSPYLLVACAMELPAGEKDNRLVNTFQALQAGLEKVISTMGIHELRGYGRLFASLGLSTPVAGVLGTLNYAGSFERGLTWQGLESSLAERMKIISGESPANLRRELHFYPKIWKAAAQVARQEGDSQAFENQAEMLGREMPVTLRHILDFRYPPVSSVAPETVDAGLTGHDLPFVISSMSFGSQGETAFRAYAEAAARLNMISINGEGGEIEDMLGKYPHNRGVQIASGRFGINIDVLNSVNLLEIKVGQGAKPGEGGHLPGRKVTEKIALTRHATQGIDLISPSNNHDIYSIEDLAQFIEELKTANPKARVAVKVPVVPGIGIIAVGIAKAGAEIINLSGYDGGTGAARAHSIKNVGLPAEIGVIEAHRALTQAGMRRKVELWCDGGMRTAADVVKMICLGANRIGFGTLPMVAAGCTICRACQKGTCHVGITTQINSVEEAHAQGLKHFVPCDVDDSVTGLVNLFSALSQGVRSLTARLGFKRVQELVGRSDLLFQYSALQQLDMGKLLVPVQSYMDEQALPMAELAALTDGVGPLRRPRNHLTTVISNLVMETMAGGESQVSFEDDKVTPVDRALGTHLTGAMTRHRRAWAWAPGHGGIGGTLETWRASVNGNGNGNGNGQNGKSATLRFYASSVPGNGLGAYNSDHLNINVEGGAQEGVAKSMRGGRVVVLKGYNHDGLRIDGSVGKSLAYGAMGGLVIVQGNADSRACIRLSGADVVIGGEIPAPLDDRLGSLGARANIKGFLCEYMTDGRVLVLGDPGPWICAGMTGGVLYLRPQLNLNLDLQAIRRRLARGAKVLIRDVEDSDETNLQVLLTEYAEELTRSQQPEEAEKALALRKTWRTAFIKIIPSGARQLDQSVATE